MNRLDDNHDAFRFEVSLIKQFGDLGGQPLLDLRAPGEDISDAGQFGEPDNSVLIVSDDKRGRMLRFDGAGRYLGTFPDRDASKRKVTRILIDGEGAIVTLDRDEKTVGVWSETGQLLRKLGPAGLKKPADVAVDPFRNLYVADEDLGVLVFDPRGRLLVTVGGPELRNPHAVTLDPAGAIVVYDDREQRILRYR